MLFVADKDNFFSAFSLLDDFEKAKNDNKVFFNLAKIENKFDFTKNPDRNLDDNEWFFIEYFINKDIKTDMDKLFAVFNSSASYPNLTSAMLKDLRYLFCECEDKINIQNIKKANFIKSKSILFFETNGVEYRNLENTLTFNDKIDIFIDSEKIYFKNFNELKFFNDKFMEFYRTANPEEVKKFTNLIKDKISLFSINLEIAKIGTRNSKKIKYALDNNLLDNFENKEKQIQKYIKKYNIEIKFENGVFAINDNKKLTNFMDIIFENHYTGAITNRHLLASSNETINSKKKND